MKMTLTIEINGEVTLQKLKALAKENNVPVDAKVDVVCAYGIVGGGTVVNGNASYTSTLQPRGHTVVTFWWPQDD